MWITSSVAGMLTIPKWEFPIVSSQGFGFSSNYKSTQCSVIVAVYVLGQSCTGAWKIVRIWVSFETLMPSQMIQCTCHISFCLKRNSKNKAEWTGKTNIRNVDLDFPASTHYDSSPNIAVCKRWSQALLRYHLLSFLVQSSFSFPLPSSSRPCPFVAVVVCFCLFVVVVFFPLAAFLLPPPLQTAMHLFEGYIWPAIHFSVVNYSGSISSFLPRSGVLKMHKLRSRLGSLLLAWSRSEKSLACFVCCQNSSLLFSSFPLHSTSFIPGPFQPLL